MSSFRFFCISDICILLFLSCTNLEKEKLHTNVHVNNEALRTAITEYDSILNARNPEKDYLLLIYERQLCDTMFSYSISYELGTAAMQNAPISLAEVDGIYVEFVKSTDSYGLLITDEKLRDDIARRYFPEEYSKLENDRTINCYYTNDDVEMHLTFCKDSLIEKRIIGISY